MWFQDLFNYDFRRTEQCIIPYATQEGEISFCAYNTGVGWRNIIEKMHMTATLTKWYEEHGRHEIFAGGKKVNMDEPATATEYLNLREEIVTNELQHDLDKLGIAKNAREEKKRARDAKAAGEARGPEKNDAAYNARMASLYREVVLKEKPVQSENGFIPLGALAKPNGNGQRQRKWAPCPGKQAGVGGARGRRLVSYSAARVIGGPFGRPPFLCPVKVNVPSLPFILGKIR